MLPRSFTGRRRACALSVFMLFAFPVLRVSCAMFRFPVFCVQVSFRSSVCCPGLRLPFPFPVLRFQCSGVGFPLLTFKFLFRAIILRFVFSFCVSVLCVRSGVVFGLSLLPHIAWQFLVLRTAVLCFGVVRAFGCCFWPVASPTHCVAVLGAPHSPPDQGVFAPGCRFFPFTRFLVDPVGQDCNTSKNVKNHPLL